MFRVFGFEGIGVLCVVLAYLIVGGGFGVVAGGLHSPYVSFLICAAVFIPVLAWTVVLGLRFARVRRRLARTQQDFEVEMAQLLEEIRSRCRQQCDADRLKTLRGERQRIMRDVHDGLGGLLVQAVALTEEPGQTGQLREVLSFALHDLRLIVNSLNPGESSLADLISTFRHFHDRAKGAEDCRYEWWIDDLDGVRLEPSQSMSILRVLQEALTNVAKHARATRVRVHVGRSGAHELLIAVEDNGIGFAKRSHRGCGVASMKRRAAELNGQLTIGSSAKGACVQMRIPVDGEDGQPEYASISVGAALRQGEGSRPGPGTAFRTPQPPGSSHGASGLRVFR